MKLHTALILSLVSVALVQAGSKSDGSEEPSVSARSSRVRSGGISAGTALKAGAVAGAILFSGAATAAGAPAGPAQLQGLWQPSAHAPPVAAHAPPAHADVHGRKGYKGSRRLMGEKLAPTSSQKDSYVAAQIPEMYEVDGLRVYPGVKDGCELLNCPSGTFCGVRKGTAKLGHAPFQQFLFPKCVHSEAELYQNTDQDGNAHVEVMGPGCEQVECAENYQCQVRVSTAKLGELPYAQSRGPALCVNSSVPASDVDTTSTVVVNGPGCDEIDPCNAGEECVTYMGLAKLGGTRVSQFFWPFCSQKKA